MKKGLFLFGFLNSVLMYLLYPVYRLLEIASVAYGSLYTLVFILVCVIHIIVNILVYSIFIKNKEKDLNTKWLTVSLGGSIGGIATMIILLCISLTKIHQEYTYIKSAIPFHLNYVKDLKYFLFVLVYNLFLYELSRKAYLFFKQKNSHE